MLTRFWKTARTAIGSPRAFASGRRTSPRFEPLEARQMLSGAGSDYLLSGFSWANPGKITYSIPADGVAWDQGTNNLNATLDAEVGPGWKRDFARALATWAASANIDVIPVADSDAPLDAPGLAQSDPRFGDIRVGGYNFNDATTLAQTYFPPPNGLTEAGDVEVNTAFNWGPSGPYDYFSVMLHEVGHSLGLQDVTGSTSVENQQYLGVRTGLTPWDVQGIQSIYGARQPDALQAKGQGISFATAVDLTGQLGTGAQATLASQSLATIGDVEYYTFVAPAGSGEVASARVAAENMSLLSPKVTIYDASGHALAADADAAAWSDDVQANAAGIVPGQRYFVAVTGATDDVFAVGAFAFQLAIHGATPPAPAPTPAPVTPPAPAPTPAPAPPAPAPAPPPTIPKDGFSLSGPSSPMAYLGPVSTLVVPNLTLASAGDVNAFSFQPARAGTVAIATGSTRIEVANQYGQVVASGVGSVSFPAPSIWTRYYVVITSANGQANPDFALGIAVLLPTSWNPWATAPARQAVATPAFAPTAPEPAGAPASGPSPWSYSRVPVVNNRLWRPGY